MDMREKKLTSEDVYKGKMLHIKKDKVLCPNGKESTREYVVHPGASAIIANLDGKYILETQYRYPLDEIIYEIPAGKLEIGEDPMECASRELEEETGYKAKDISYLGKMYSSCGFTNEVIYLYYANNLVKTKTSFDEDEFIEIESYSLDELLNMIDNGTIVDAKSICAISLLSRKIKK